MTKHVVKQGECMTSIARRYGFADPMVIYDAPANAGLRRRRPDPNVLDPGDELEIPVAERKSVSCSPGEMHTFEVTLPRKEVRLVLRAPSGKPLDGVPWVLRCGEREWTGTTGQDGVVTAKVDALARSVELGTAGGPLQRLALAHLNPVKETEDQGISGVQARLRNLGYGDVPIDGVIGPVTRAAIRHFEQRGGLEPTGDLSDALLNKLLTEHGS